MNQDDKLEVRIEEANNTNGPNKPRRRIRIVPPVQVNDVEDLGSFNRLLDRLFSELPPQNIQQEGDLIALAQLRWITERLNSLIEREINHRVRLPHLQTTADAGNRLMLAYRLCLADRSFVLLTKQHLDTVKTLNPLSARIEKWAAPKAPRKEK
ncbi:hypothetical protein [Bryobacter aggregatus]|uniref:hypothetical protein n=1 Tax=Bryobacter aggregatus TaxID=360054 RepID=UPI0004E17895|nr:hypothetical protein [Bryobacter aggregatus]